jgi:hypothetical protein
MSHPEIFQEGQKNHKNFPFVSVLVFFAIACTDATTDTLMTRSLNSRSAETYESRKNE